MVVAVAVRSQREAPAWGKRVCVWSSSAGMLTLMKASELASLERFRRADDTLTYREKAVCASLCVCVMYINVMSCNVVKNNILRNYVSFYSTTFIW